MSELPATVTNSGLWVHLGQSPDFQQAIRALRGIAETIAAKIAELLPEFTDHSVTHMDALWSITDQIFTREEIATFTIGEAFILACSFYVHDLGMAIAATPEGVEQLRSDALYTSTYERILQTTNCDQNAAKTVALKIAARELHAEKALTIIDDKLPGLDRYLIETTDLRNQWGEHIGQVAASHHWSLQQVQRKLGDRGKVPAPIGDPIDLGLLACALRVIDYAHINATRASSLERILRSTIGAESLNHWKAQEHITGPYREGNHLVFGAHRKIADVDGWWTIYEMASGLDREITAVSEYLASRAVSAKRFSLEGVKGIKTPQSFATLVPTLNFEPVDVRFRPDSMDRLVSLLGGQTLYGDDYFAPVRELLQNARDAVLLRLAAHQAASYTSEPGEIRVTVSTTDEGGQLSIGDNGVGMSERIITNYLLGIAADYWHSPEFFADYAGANSTGFRPVGRFGIGFLSIFMIGDHVEVQTQKFGGRNVTLRLRGVGRRGSLIPNPQAIRNGTTVSVKIPRDKLGDFDNLHDVVRAKAPMLSLPVVISQQDVTTTIDPGWWKHVSQEELTNFIDNQEQIATTPERKRERGMAVDEFEYLMLQRRHMLLSEMSSSQKWPGQQPEVVSEHFRMLAVPVDGKVILCSKGFAVATERVSGMVGIVELGDVRLNAARTQTLEWNVEAFRQKLNSQLRPHILESLNSLAKERSIPSRYGFLANVAGLYGNDLLAETELPWITVVEEPGHSMLLSPATLVERLSQVREVFVVYGSGPWSVSQTVTGRFPEASHEALIIPVSAQAQPDLPSRDRETPEWGTLREHFLRSPRRPRYRSGAATFTEATLLVATLKVISRAFRVDEGELYEAQWARTDNSSLCARFVAR